MNAPQGEKPACLLCYEAVLVGKEHNVGQHFDTKHGVKYGEFRIQEKQQIVQELKGRLQSQLDMFRKATPKNDAAVRAGFIVT